MTTIVYSGGVIAADTQVTRGNLLFTGSYKLGKFGDYMWGFCGDMAVNLQVSQWIVRSIASGVPIEEWVPKLESDKAEDFGILIAHRDATGIVVFEVVVEGTMNLPDKHMWTSGSGRAIATAALLCGKTAKEAVETAMLLDIYTGGEVDILSFDSPDTMEILSEEGEEDAQA